MTCTNNVSARKQHKKENPSAKKTLDIQHTLKINQLSNTNTEISSTLCKIQKIDETIAKLREDSENDYNETTTEKIISLSDERYDLDLKLTTLSDDNYVDYLLDTGDILYKYYDMVDNGGISDMYVKPIENSILNWFSSKKSEEEDNPKDCNNKASIIDKYLQKTDKNYINPCNLAEELCSHCKSPNIVTISSEGYIECNECHSIEHIIIDHEKPSYKDPPKEISYWAYKRINHFKLEWNSEYFSLVFDIILF
jgi:hypothetical protein